MAEPRLTRFERWLAWLFYEPRGQFVLILACAGSLALCVGTDELAREYRRGSVFAPDGQDIWRGIEFGAALGVLHVISEMLLAVPRLLVSPWRVVKNWEATGWRLWVFYVSIGGQLFLTCAVVLTLLWWCTKSGFAFFPPMLAMLLVEYLAGLVWRAAFGSRSQDEVAEPVRAEN
jgi:hypothetical protein